MPRTRWHITRIPSLHLRTKFKLDRASINHNIFMLEPVLIPTLPIDLDALNIVPIIQTIGFDAQVLVPVDRHVEVAKPRRRDEVDGLRHHGVDSHHLPHEPGVHCACVAVTGDAVGRVVEAVG